jgi:regulator of RNase E activity RraB
MIIGMEEVKQISKEQLTENADRLSVTQYEEHFAISLKQELVEQYKVEDFDLKYMLLSPRAQKSANGNQYQCCCSCYNSLTKGEKKKAGILLNFQLLMDLLLVISQIS